ncbi:hypothetical protein HYT32_01135 [Candidatus Roizmanbacteria bacterium]|nr:hypothetical protein [Candidatus Roizmanbacteria bacterium]
MEGKAETIQGLDPLVGLVLSGKKPGAYIDLRNKEKCEKLGLEAVPTRYFNGSIWVERLAVGNRQLVSDVLRSKKISEIPRLKNRVRALINELNGKSVVQALAYLVEYPRKDKEFPIVEENRVERPEFAMLIGILLGYREDCVKYYIETKYLGFPTDFKAEKRYASERDNPVAYLQCPACVSNNLPYS